METILVVAVAIVMGWFVLGTIYNIRKGSAVMKWMQGGLPLLGERTTVRWLGTTAVEMVIHNARSPFGQVALVIFLEPRDVPWFWGIARWQGRRDTLIIRAQLRTTPHTDFEAVDRASWSGHEAMRRIQSERWTISEPTDQSGLPIYYKTEAALARANTLLDLMSQSELGVKRLAVHHTEPHLQIHLALPSDKTPAHDFFQDIRKLGEKAGG